MKVPMRSSPTAWRNSRSGASSWAFPICRI